MEIQKIFPTPLLLDSMPGHREFNEEIKRVIFKRRRHDPGTDSTNYSGWHSSPELWDWIEEPIVKVCDFVKLCAQTLTAETTKVAETAQNNIIPYGGAWVNLLNNGGYNQVHNHPGAVWSAVYYVDSGNPTRKIKKSGVFEFVDPRGANIYGTKYSLEPEDGLCMVFPSWLQHYVHPHHGKRPRISMAFNMDVQMIV